MTDRNRELVPDSWSQVIERALTTELCSEGWHCEHSGVYMYKSGAAGKKCKGDILKGRLGLNEK